MSVANILQILQGVYGAHNSPVSVQGTAPLVASTDWTQLMKKYVTGYHLLDAAAGTASEDSLLTVTPNYAGGIRIFGVYALPPAAVAANGSNFASLICGTRPQAGGGSQTTTGFTALTTATVSWVANSQVTLFSSAGGVLIAQNLVFTCAITKPGTGVVLPAFTYMVEFAEA